MRGDDVARRCAVVLSGHESHRPPKPCHATARGCGAPERRGTGVIKAREQAGRTRSVMPEQAPNGDRRTSKHSCGDFSVFYQRLFPTPKGISTQRQY